MGILEAIKKGFGVAGKNLGLVLILFIFNLIWSVVNVALTPASALPAPGTPPVASPALPPQVAMAAFAFSILFILISIFVQGGSLGLVRDYIKEGKIKLAQFASYGFKYYVRLLLLGLLILAIIIVVAVIAALIIAATMGMNNTVMTVIASIIAIAIGLAAIYLVLLLAMSPYAMICEETGIIVAMKKSINVVMKSFWKILLLLAVLILIAIGVGVLLGVVTGLMAAILPARVGQMVMALVNSIFNGYFGVVMTASFMVFYLALAGREKAA